MLGVCLSSYRDVCRIFSDLERRVKRARGAATLAFPIRLSKLLSVSESLQAEKLRTLTNKFFYNIATEIRNKAEIASIWHDEVKFYFVFTKDKQSLSAMFVSLSLPLSMHCGATKSPLKDLHYIVNYFQN